MKKTLFLLILIPGLLVAQDKEPRLELEASYGLLSSAQILTITQDVFVEILTLGTAVDKDNYRIRGPLFLSGRYYLKPWLGVGLAMGSDLSKADLMSEEGMRVGEFVYSSLVMAAECKFRYLNTEFVQVYSGLGVGYRLGKEKTRYLEDPLDEQFIGYLTGQFNLIGLRIGKGFGGFMELGYGYKGIINAGFTMHF